MQPLAPAWDTGRAMSQENVEIVRRHYEHRESHGDFLDEIIAPDYVWDMSHFRGWPEQRTYEGIDERGCSSENGPPPSMIGR